MRSWLKEKRESLHLTHDQVAERCDISRSYYTLIENGKKTPSISVAKSISSALNLHFKCNT